MDERYSFGSADHFTEHPDSIAGHLKRQASARLHNSASKRTGVPRVPVQRRPDDGPRRLKLREPAIIRVCPLGDSWFEWDMFVTAATRLRFVPEGQKERCASARRTIPSVNRGRVKLEWENPHVAGIAPTRSSISDRHMHAEVTIGARLVHIDVVRLVKGGPGRSIVEVRVFVDGELAGRGGSVGCSLGGGGSDLPAVAAVSDSTVLTVHLIYGREVPVVELWDVSSRV